MPRKLNLPRTMTATGAAIEHADRVIALINECEIVDIGEKLHSVEDLLSDWALAGVDLECDFVLVWSGGDVVAYAEVPGPRTYCTVHPLVRGQGIGIELLGWIEQRALDRASPNAHVRVGQTLPDNLEVPKEMLTSRFYEPRHYSWILRFPGAAPVMTPVLPAGYLVRQYRPAEEQEVYQVVEDAFNEWPGRTPATYESWQARTTRRVDFESELLLVAEYDQRVVGVLFAIDYNEEGWVDELAVASDHRGRGLAKVLLARAFEIFKTRGQTNVGLSTDSRTGALDLYLALGMQVDRSFTHYSKILRPATATTSQDGQRSFGT